MSEPSVLVEHRGSTGVLTLDRAGKRNPLSSAAMVEFTAALRELGADPEIAVIVVRARGPAFSAGHDLSELVGAELEDQQEVFRLCTEMMEAVQQVPQPVVAAVRGAALAAGCQLVASCDLVVAAEAAVFGTPGVRIGLFCSTPMVPLSRAIGRKRALQMLLTGEAISAERAADWGLVNEVVPAEQLEQRVGQLVEQIAAASPLTLRTGKQAFYRQIDLPQHEAYEQMREVMANNAVTRDAQEGMAAFLDKREPVWRGE
jgi:enoyl-CoA hydratase/carnithine racemase